jgi:molecular chaperone DnaJ
MAETYYEILGIEVDASDEEIRKAYKKRAMEWHPDRANGSEEKFKKLVKAYGIISNPETRKKYDRRLNNSSSTFASKFSKVASAATTTAKKVMNDFVDDGLFETLDKFLGRKKEPKNIEANIKITIEELYSGADKQVKFKRFELCEACGGRGAEGRSDIKMCVECYGLGHTNLASLFTKEDCKKCGGTGKILLKKCKQCKGKGEKKYDRDFVFTIPKDINLGKGKERDTLIVRNEGEYGGDLLLQVDLKQHKYYEVKWPDLYIDLPIKFYQAILGDNLEIETLRGKAFFQVPSGAESGDTIVLNGYGLRKTDKNNNQKLGDLYINLLMTLPKRINKEQRRLLEEYRDCDRSRKKAKPKRK